MEPVHVLLPFSTTPLILNILYGLRQDQLTLSAIIASFTPTLISFIASTRTYHEAWNTLANTYDNLTKGTQSITKYLQSIRTIFDKFIMFNTSPDHEEFILQILGGIDDDYKDLYSALLIHEIPITFNELHE